MQGRTERNLPVVRRLVTRGGGERTRFICLRNVPIFWRGKTELRELAEDEASSQSLACLTELANAHQVFISAGSLMMQADGEDGQANRNYLIGPDGTILSRYDKIHMFDADVGDGKRYRESDNFRPGQNSSLPDRYRPYRADHRYDIWHRGCIASWGRPGLS